MVGSAAAGGMIIAAAIGLLVVLLRGDGIGRWITLGLAAWVGTILAATLSIGPQLATITCFAALIAVLQYSFDGWRGRWHWCAVWRWGRDDWSKGQDSLTYRSARLRALWLATPIFAVWANFDGAFLIGLAIFWIYMLGRAIDAVSQRGRAGFGLARRMLLMLIAASLATLLNPYGPWLFGWLTHPGTYPLREALHGVAVPISDSVAWPLMLFLLTVAAVAYLANRRRFDPSQSGGLIVAFAASLSDSRYAALFALAAGCWLAAPLNELPAALRAMPSRRRSPPISLNTCTKQNHSR
jgi:hypothetical protein